MELIIESFFRKAKNRPTTIGPYPMKMQRLWYKFERKLALTQWKSANYWCNEKKVINSREVGGGLVPSITLLIGPLVNTTNVQQQ